MLAHHRFHRLLIDGIRRRDAKNGRKVDRKMAFTWAHVKRTREFLNPYSSKDMQLYTALSTGVSFLLRSSVLLPGTDHSLLRSSVRFRSVLGALKAVTIVIHSSKTSRTPVSRTLLHNGPQSTCQLLFNYLQRTKGAPSSPLFAGLSYRMLNENLKSLGELMGIPNARCRLASHSLRRGGATSLFNHGIPPMFIREFGRWSQDMWVTVYAELSFDQQLALTQAYSVPIASPGSCL